MKVRDVEPKHISGFGNVFLRENFKDNIELPCLEACLYFYDLNIATSSANCHRDDPNVYLYFDATSLNEENTIIANNLVKEGILKYLESGDGSKWYGICFSATLDDEVEEISERLLSVAKMFKQQDVISPRWTKTKEMFISNLFTFFDADYIKLCDNFGIAYCLTFENGEVVFRNEESYYKLENENRLNEFEEKLKNLIEAKYQKLVEIGMADDEKGIIFVNSELAKKHWDYIEKQKGMGTKK